MANILGSRFSLAGVRAGVRAEDQDDDAPASEEEDDAPKSEEDDDAPASDEDDDAPKSDDDEEDEATEDDEDSPKEAAAFVRGRQSEARRWNKVLNSDAAPGREETALSLLGTTDLPGSKIVGTLSTISVAASEPEKGETLADRMGRKPRSQVKPGGNKGAATDEDKGADKLLQNYTRATGVKPLSA